MGALTSIMYLNGRKPEVVPDTDSVPTFDPEYGFEIPRKPRVSHLSEQEMKALKIPKSMRDYCAHFWKDYLVCAREYKPIIGLCKPEYHAYEHCEFEDYRLRMMEYEREKRLRIRAQKKEKAAVS